MTIDITPEAVEHLCAIHEGYEQHGTVATLRALSAALTASQAETAAVYEAAAMALDAVAGNWSCGHDAKNCDCHRDIEQWTFAADECRALTPADSKAALDRMLAEARADGMREAAAIADECSEIAVKNRAEAEATGERVIWWLSKTHSDMARDKILAAITKGKDHE